MTISPLAPATPAPARAGSSRPTSDGGFGALVEHHLASEQAHDAAPRSVDHRAARAHGAKTGSATDSSADSATGSQDAASVPGTASASGPMAGPVPSTVTARSTSDSTAGDAEDATVTGAVPAPSAGASEESASSPTAGQVPAPVAAGHDDPSTDPAATRAAGAPVADGDAADAARTGAAQPQRALAAPVAAAVDGAPQASGEDSKPEPGLGSAAATGPEASAVAAGAPTAAPAAHLAAPAQKDSQTSAPAGVAGPATSTASQQGVALPVHAAAGAAAPAAADTQAAPGSAVTAQVFDHVTRLVSRGDGTHRMMLRLHPADLGEVKVVLTVRNNTVDVTLSAGPAAREALRDGSPQLRALLELTGATTGQLVVRDHAHAGSVVPSASTTWTSGQQPGGHSSQAGQQSPTDSGASLSGESGPGGDGRGGRPSPGRSDATALASARTSSVPAAATTRVAAARLDLDL